MNDLDLGDSSSSDDEQEDTSSNIKSLGEDKDRYEDALELRAETVPTDDLHEENPQLPHGSGAASSKYAKSQRRMPKTIKKKVCRLHLPEGVLG